MNVKFAHMSDVHLGAWRRENLNICGYEAFEKAIDICIEEKVDFVIISGDLYDTSNPKVDVVDLAIKKLRELSDNNIPVYAIMGSHDFSPSEKTMIRPLISAGFYTDLYKGSIGEDNKIYLEFTEDPKSKIKLTGMRARKRALEVEDFQRLAYEPLEQEEGAKIFVFHTMLQELKPSEYAEMESAPKSYLPKHFNYYAGGHLHKTVPESLRENGRIIINDKNNIVYPGCLFPTDFRELEKFNHGGFCMVQGDINNHLEVRFIPVRVKDVINLKINCNNKSVLEILNELTNLIDKNELEDKIATLRIAGTLSSGKAYEINSAEIENKFKEKNAYEILINKCGVFTKGYSSIRVALGKTNEEIEKTLIHEHSQITELIGYSKKQLEDNIHRLIDIIGKEREEGSNVKDYKAHLIESFNNVFELEDLED